MKYNNTIFVYTMFIMQYDNIHKIKKKKKKKKDNNLKTQNTITST